MTRALLVLLAVTGCKDKSAKHDARPFEHPPIADAMVDAPVDWSACDAAIKQAAAAPPYDRPKILIDGCAVCGSWRPLLDWAVLPKDGGPRIAEIDTAFRQCDAICDGGVGKRVASALDNTRGTDSRAPWRIIGEGCKEKVSAVPDARYMSAAYFALDRIGRTVAGRGGEAGKLLETIEVPLPPATMSGVGPTLPPGPPAPAGRLAISLLGPELRIGKMPVAKLGTHGITVDADYPGALVAKLDDLAGAIAKAAPGGPVVVLAPKALPATRIAELSRAAKAPLALGVAAPNPPTDWQLPAVLAVAIDAKAGKRVDITAAMTVEDLAKELAPLAGNGVTGVALAVKR